MERVTSSWDTTFDTYHARVADGRLTWTLDPDFLLKGAPAPHRPRLRPLPFADWALISASPLECALSHGHHGRYLRARCLQPGALHGAGGSWHGYLVEWVLHLCAIHHA